MSSNLDKTEPPDAPRPPEPRRRTKVEHENLMWACFSLWAKGIYKTEQEVAADLGISYWYCSRLISRARRILKKTRGFDPLAPNIQQEMLKFLPLAAAALEHNLIKAEPRTLVAYLQGVRALVPQQEIANIPESDRERVARGALKAMNPRLRAALEIDAEVTTVEEKATP
jgi:hypothetical protein